MTHRPKYLKDKENIRPDPKSPEPHLLIEDDAGKYYLYGDDARCFEVLGWDIQRLSEAGDKRLALGDKAEAQKWFAKMNAISQLRDKIYARTT